MNGRTAAIPPQSLYQVVASRFEELNRPPAWLESKPLIRRSLTDIQYLDNII